MACMKFSEGLCESLKGRVVLNSVSLHEDDFHFGPLNKEALNFCFHFGMNTFWQRGALLSGQAQAEVTVSLEVAFGVFFM